MDHRLTSIQRAVQLASSGTFTEIDELKKWLTTEGYDASRIEDDVLIEQLEAAMKATKKDDGEA